MLWVLLQSWPIKVLLKTTHMAALMFSYVIHFSSTTASDEEDTFHSLLSNIAFDTWWSFGKIHIWYFCVISFDLEYSPTMCTECQVYLQTVLGLAALFPQKCKRLWADLSGCVAFKMRSTRLKPKQADELKRSALCGVLKSAACLGNMSM